MLTVYGAPGWGSAISELMLSLAEIPYQFVDVEGFDKPGPQRETLLRLNPLAQVPTLQLDDGSIMTESAAIALMILDSRPDLAPAPGTAERMQFQRLLIWFVANVYPTFTFADYPERWVSTAPDELRESCDRYRKSLYLWLETQVQAAPFALGPEITLLDLYFCVMRGWGPRQGWFKDNTPKLYAIADAVCARSELHGALRRNGII